MKKILFQTFLFVFCLMLIGSEATSLAHALVARPLSPTPPTRLDQTCSQAEQKLSEEITGLTTIRQQRLNLYNQITQNITSLDQKLSQKGYDTTTVANDVTQLNGYITSYATDAQTVITSLTTTQQTYPCGTSEGKFVEGITKAEQLLKTSLSDRQTINSFWTNTLKPAVVALKKQLASGDIQETLNCTTCNPQAVRTYLLHLPKGYNQSTHYPLVLVLHGSGGTPQAAEKMSGFSKKADQAGIIVAYPAGIGTAISSQNLVLPWNAGLTPGQPDDVGFFKMLIANVEADYTIDATRVYMSGISDGAAETENVGCQMGSTFAAISLVSFGKSNVTPCNKGTIPVVAFHGTADTVIPYTDGETYIRFWALHNRCRNVPPVPSTTPPAKTFSGSVPSVIDPLSNAAPDVDVNSYTQGCQSPVSFYTIIGGQHEWPGPGATLSKQDKEINATDVSWSFFSQYHR